MAKRSGRPRTARWRRRLEDQARRDTTSRVQHIARTTTDPTTREVYTQEAAIREAVTPTDADVAAATDGGASDCPLGDDWHDTYIATGYPCCVRCQTHHRHPETCPGINPDGTEADYPPSPDDWPDGCRCTLDPDGTRTTHGCPHHAG